MSHIKEPCGHNYYRDECPMCSVSDEIEQEIAALKAEIERLESENGYLLAQIKGAKREIIQREDNCRKSVVEIRRLKHEINNLINYLEEIRCNSKDEFSVFIANEALLKSEYAENLSSSPEDKSALEEKPDSSES